MSLHESELNELVDVALKAFAESLRDQAALKAEQDEDWIAEALRTLADRIEP